MMRKMMLLLAVCVMASAAMARLDVAVTNQCWTFSDSAGPSGMRPDNPDGNPYANGSIASINTPPTYGPTWNQLGYWEAPLFNIVIGIPNNPVQNAYKRVEVEIVYRGSLALSWIVDDQGNQFARTDRSDDPVAGTDWRILKDVWYIAPNPNFETLCFGFAGMDQALAAIDRICVTTYCVPEPATLAVLGLGSLALLGRRRRA
jgi:hypothetical protein